MYYLSNCCITNYPKSQCLKTILFLGFCVSGILVQLSWIFTSYNQGVGLGCGHLQIQLRVHQLLILNSLPWLLVGFSPLWAVGWRGSVYCWLLARSHSQSHAMWASPLCRSSGLIGAGKLELKREDRQVKPVFCNQISEVTLHHFSCVLLVTSKYEYQKAGILGGHFRRLPTTTAM